MTDAAAAAARLRMQDPRKQYPQRRWDRDPPPGAPP